MTAAQTKIITKLLERRQIEADLRHMLEANTDLEFRRRAQGIAASGSEVIPTIIGNLDRADARLLTAMGVVTTFLDRQDIVGALRAAILESRLSDQGRVGAMAILQRFLGEGPDEQLLGSLDDPQGVTLSSLRNVLREAGRDPGVLVQYVESLDRQEPDVVLAVARQLLDVAGQAQSKGAGAGQERGGVVELLRMMAQDVRGEIAAAAIESLGTLRQPEAAQALQTLLPAVAPDLHPVAERLLRKLQFSGVEVNPLPAPDPDWRTLISPPGGQGQQAVWFLFQQGEAAQVRFLNVLLHDRAGAVEAVGHPQVPALMLPPRRSRGYVHDVALPDASGIMLMLEASFDVGRRLVRDALEDNRETQIPVAGLLRLRSPWLWGLAGGDELPARQLPKIEIEIEAEAETGDDFARRSAGLLGHPAFVSWTLRGELLMGAAEEIVRQPGRNVERSVRRLAAELFSNSEVAWAFRRRLEAMSEWLLLAGDEAAARVALRTARGLTPRPAEQPFVQALVRRDLGLILKSLENTWGTPGDG
ncbi:MAG: hypothetical protein P8129_02340 [Anaerolineae bacterium]